MNLNECWNELNKIKTSGLKQLRFPSACAAELFLGINDKGKRVLLLYCPEDCLHLLKIQNTSDFANISIEACNFSGYNAIVITLKSPLLNEIFDDLILSLYNKISKENLPLKYTSIFIDYYTTWSSLFEPLLDVSHSKQEVMGLVGELIVLFGLLNNPTYCQNETLAGWRGPYGDEKDFVFGVHALEVKSLPSYKDEINISSEYQLEPIPGKELKLVVIELSENNEGKSLQYWYQKVKDLINSKYLDQSIFLKGLKEFKINQTRILEYEKYKFCLVGITYFDVNTEAFPSIRKSKLSLGIKNVKYNLTLTGIEMFKAKYDLLHL